MKNTLIAIILIITTLCMVNCEISSLVPEKNDNENRSEIKKDTVKINPSIDDWPEPGTFEGIAKEKMK